jgi:polar amino acid transport system permease protein
LDYDFSVIVKDFHLFLPATGWTILITTSAILIGILIGFIVSLCKVSKIKFLEIPATIYITIIRGTPLILQLFVIYYGIVNIITLNAFLSASIAFGLHNGAYIAEIFRGAIESIDKGQFEAAESIGMTKFKTMERIILPQAIKRAIPALGNQFIIATKDSSLAYYISIRELFAKSQQLGASTFKDFEYLLVAGIYYLIITTTLGLLVHRIEYKLAISER